MPMPVVEIERPQLSTSPDDPVVLIAPTRGWIGLDWKEMVRYRDLLYFLVWRDVKIRYKQTVLGFAWAILQPLLGTVVFTIIFGRLAKIESDGLPYAAFVLAGLIPWSFFSQGLTQGGQSLLNQQQLMTKIYFPRLFVPTATVAAGLVDLAVSMLLYAAVLVIYHIVPGWSLLALPPLILLTLAATLGLVYLLAALTVTYRDFRYVVPFMVQAMMYLSPVVYPVSIVPKEYQWVLALNPMAGIIDGFRSAILNKPWNFTTLAVSTASAVVLLFCGTVYFRKTERRFADIA